MHSIGNDGIAAVGNLPVEETNQTRLGEVRAAQKELFGYIKHARNRGEQHRGICVRWLVTICFTSSVE